MCDTLCVRESGRTFFAKNSDRPPDEPQVLEAYPRRTATGALRVQYVTLPDADSFAVVGSRPTWLWGFEHGVNEHGVAIGNEKVWTVDDPRNAPVALLGMDLVRLGLERGATADAAVDVMTRLLERHGQGGSGEHDRHAPYFSSFLVADATSGWILETSGRTWAARPFTDRAAISNRISLGTNWVRGSRNLSTGDDFQALRHPRMPTEIADHRLAVTTALTRAEPAAIVETLRHHGNGARPPRSIGPEYRGVTVCMHTEDQATTASLFVDLTESEQPHRRLWCALGNPCLSVYLPLFMSAPVPVALSEEYTWRRFAALRAQTERDDQRYDIASATLRRLEGQIWERADEAAVAHADDAITRYQTQVWAEVDAALTGLGV
jgi:secernin